MLARALLEINIVFNHIDRYVSRPSRVLLDTTKLANNMEEYCDGALLYFNLIDLNLNLNPDTNEKKKKNADADSFAEIFDSFRIDAIFWQ